VLCENFRVLNTPFIPSNSIGSLQMLSPLGKLRPLLAVLITTHNRELETQKCLSHLLNATLPPHWDLSVHLTLDCCDPGTYERLKADWPEVQFYSSSKPLYWGGGSLLAWRQSLHLSPSAWLLLNQDTYLYPSALTSLFYTQSSRPLAICAGKTWDPRTNSISYGGWEFHPRKIGQFTPHSTLSSMANGNALLIGIDTYQKIGKLNPIFSHRLGDFDYTLTGTKLGIKTLLPQFPIAQCEKTPPPPLQGTWKQRLLHPKNLDLVAQTAFLWKHAPASLPLLTLKTLIHATFPTVWKKLRDNIQV